MVLELYIGMGYGQGNGGALLIMLSDCSIGELIYT